MEHTSLPTEWQSTLAENTMSVSLTTYDETGVYIVDK